MLVLPIRRKWFDMIKSREKLEEYREIKPYYNRCLGNEVIGFPFTETIIKNIESIREYDENQFKDFEVVFRNGYRADSPKLKCKCKLRVGTGKLDWGAEPNKEYYILTILKVLEVKNYEG